MMIVARFTHPDLKDVSLDVALHALADPVRLEMVRSLACVETLNCAGTSPCGVPKSTVSNHLRVLRAAGLVETIMDGREGVNRLRREAFDRRFPGLLETVLANACQGDRQAG